MPQSCRPKAWAGICCVHAAQLLTGGVLQAEAQKEKERREEEAAKEEAARKKEELRQAELAELDVSSCASALVEDKLAPGNSGD